MTEQRPDTASSPPLAGQGPQDNGNLSFLLESSGIRGRHLKLGEAIDSILTAHRYPEPVAQMLGELVTLCALLGSTLKFDGVFVLQIKGSGPISTMVADMTSDGVLRGYAGFDADKVAGLLVEDLRQEGPAEEDQVARWFGEGHLAFTVDQGEYSERYQGLVELSGPQLSDCLLQYFRQSQQLNAGIVSACAKQDGKWRSGAMLLEQIPESASADKKEEELEDWRRALILMSSCKPEELLDKDLPYNVLLFRLFHEEGVRVFDSKPLRFGCRCSQERVESILKTLVYEELEQMKTDAGLVEVNCEFCNSNYSFDDAQLASLFKK
ncbi:Hsp33 family molecular chaperone HslO [Rhodovibrionaceae bacterium A322]